MTGGTGDAYSADWIGIDGYSSSSVEQIGTESDEAKKLALLEDFAAKYPKHEGVSWVYEQLVAAYDKTSQPDKLLATGEKLLALRRGSAGQEILIGAQEGGPVVLVDSPDNFFGGQAHNFVHRVPEHPRNRGVRRRGWKILQGFWR